MTALTNVYVVTEEYWEGGDLSFDVHGVFLSENAANNEVKDLSKKYRWLYFKVIETQIKG